MVKQLPEALARTPGLVLNFFCLMTCAEAASTKNKTIKPRHAATK
jgi:hypothetical protein